MKWFAKLFCMVVLMLCVSSNVFAWCSGDCDCCRCPSGQAQCLGSYSSCEEACGLTSKPDSPGNSDYDNGAVIREQQRLEDERRAEEQQRRDADNKRRLEEIERQTKFLEDRDAAVSTLRGSTGTSGGSALRGNSADTGLRGLKSDTTQTPNLDPMVVDTRDMPSGLPKSVDNAIDSAYQDAPPGVRDRVRKGFQAVMNKDWNVAKAWFQDALNHDPDNAGLKQLVAQADYTPVRASQAMTLMSHTATAGDRALSEEMFENGMQFLIMGDFEHADEMFRQAGFQRNIDAGKPFYDKQDAR